jgi:hypothetical protein
VFSIAVFMLVIPYALLRRGRIMQAAWIFSVSGPVIFTALVIFAGGVRSPESLPTQTVQASIHRSCFHTQTGVAAAKTPSGER